MSNRYRRHAFVGLIVILIGCVNTASAQSSFDCWSRRPPSFGLSAGVSSPYFEPSSALAREEPGSVSSGSGPNLTGRAELPVAGPLRLRLDAGRSKWDVRRKVFDPAAGYAVTSDRSIGSISARHLAGLITMTTTRSVPCGYVGVGGGFYSVGFRNAIFRSPAFALAAGMEIPTGARGALQLDAALHFVNSRTWRPITTSSDVLTLNLVIGWAHRF
jgi:hypothetical protein